VVSGAQRVGEDRSKKKTNLECKSVRNFTKFELLDKGTHDKSLAGGGNTRLQRHGGAHRSKSIGTEGGEGEENGSLFIHCESLSVQGLKFVSQEERGRERAHAHARASEKTHTIESCAADAVHGPLQIPLPGSPQG